ncbi:MAG TPA: hypothetical protein VF556_02075 [Pyrinomonadaceae bacterium]|jgi:hypothetical protein
MKFIQHLFTAALLILMSSAFAAAQTESDLKSYFEGRRVEVKIDMPATKDGINVYPNRRQPIDYGKYSNLLKTYGVGVEEGQRIMITKIKVKDKHIEFQLGGGGYGTFGDETSTSVYVPSADKTRREKHLEKEIKYESDERRRRRMREELDYLRTERRREDNHNRAEVATAEELAKQRIQEKRLQGGSRFNIRFDEKLTYRDLTPEVIMDALSEYLDFSEVRGR